MTTPQNDKKLAEIRRLARELNDLHRQRRELELENETLLDRLRESKRRPDQTGDQYERLKRMLAGDFSDSPFGVPQWKVKQMIASELSPLKEEYSILREVLKRLWQERVQLSPQMLEPLRRKAITFNNASRLLGVTVRQIRRLVKLGKLESIGSGHSKKVTTASVAQYGGFTIPS